MKLNNLQKNILIFFSIIISIFLVTLLWDQINLPLNKTIITSEFSNLKSYNQSSDTLRFTFFILLPLIVFLFLNQVLKKKSIRFKDLVFEEDEKVINCHPAIIIISFIFIIFIFLEFFSINFSLGKEFSNYRFDPMHDGNYLTPTQNYFITKNIWTSSFLVHGGSDIFYTSLIWKILGIKSIAATKTFNIFFILLLKLLCIALSYQLTKILKLTRETKILFFTILTTILLSMSAYKFTGGGSAYYFSKRDIYIVLFLIFFIELFIDSKLRYIATFLICFISIISILLHYDTGIYINFILISYCFYLFASKKYKDIFLIFISLTIFWVIAINLLSLEEFKAFLKNTITMVTSINLMIGLKYPIPFLSLTENPDGARATRGLILQLTAGFFVLNSLLDKKKLFISKKVLFVFLFFLSLIMYKNALGRSDSGHIRNSQDIPLLINSFFVLNYILIFIEKKIFAKNYSSHKFFVSISLLFLIFFYSFNNDHYKINNIINYKKNFSTFINTADNIFLDKETIKFIEHYKKISKNDNCIENITFNDAIPYLIKKPSCTKYWVSFLASPIDIQKDYINKIKLTKPEYILYSSFNHKLDEIGIYERIELVNSYILSYYDLHEEIYGYKILKRNLKSF